MDINFDDVFGGPPRLAALILSSHSVASPSALLDKGTGRTPSFRNSSLPVFDLPVFGDDASSRSIFYDSRANSNVHGRLFDEAGPSPDNVVVSGLHCGSRSKSSSRSSSRRMSPVHPAFASSGQVGGDDKAPNKTRLAAGRLSRRVSVSSTSSFNESGGKAPERTLSGAAKESHLSSVPCSSLQSGSVGHQKISAGLMDGINIATLQFFVDSDDVFGGYYPQTSYTQLFSGVPHTSDSHGSTKASNAPGLQKFSSLDALGSPDTSMIALGRSSSTEDGRQQEDNQVSAGSQIDISGFKQSEPPAGTTSIASHCSSSSQLLISEGPTVQSPGTPLKYKSWKDLLSEPPAGTSFTSRRTGLVVPSATELALENDTATAFVEKHKVLQTRQEAKEYSAEMEKREMQALLLNARKYKEQVERENYNTKFPGPVAKLSGKHIPYSEEHESRHAHEKDSDETWKEWRKFGHSLSGEISVDGLQAGCKTQADNVTGEGNIGSFHQVLKLWSSPDGLSGLHSEIDTQKRNKNLAKQHMQGRSDGLRKNASFHGFSTSQAQEISGSNGQSRSMSSTLMQDIDASADVFEEIEGETNEHRKLRWDDYVRARKRAEKALEEMQQRDAELQRQEGEMQQFYDAANEKIKRWAAGKEVNLRALLSNLQHVLWSESGWQPIPLSDLIEVPGVKKAYRKATLFVHPDKMQQKGATMQQKYIAEKVYDLLQAAWKTFSLQESL